MKIETKLNINSKIFFINGRKVIESTVQGIKIEIYEDSISVMYLCNSEKDCIVNIKVQQEHAYRTKSELLKSL